MNVYSVEDLERVVELQSQLLDIIGELEQIARGDGWAESYIIAHLKIVASEGHGYLDSSQNIDDWIHQIERSCGVSAEDLGEFFEGEDDE